VDDLQYRPVVKKVPLEMTKYRPNSWRPYCLADANHAFGMSWTISSIDTKETKHDYPKLDAIQPAGIGRVRHWWRGCTGLGAKFHCDHRAQRSPTSPDGVRAAAAQHDGDVGSRTLEMERQHLGLARGSLRAAARAGGSLGAWSLGAAGQRRVCVG
jgi:hypothetical protein